jgi:hypothetical protein
VIPAAATSDDGPEMMIADARLGQAISGFNAAYTLG